MPLGVVEADQTGTSNHFMRRRRGYRNLRYLLLKAQRMATFKTEFVAFRRVAYKKCGLKLWLNLRVLRMIKMETRARRSELV